MCILCVYDDEECECGVGDGVKGTILSETLVVISFTETTSRTFRLNRFRKKPMNLCVSDREERDHGVGAGVNATMLSGASAARAVRCEKNKWPASRDCRGSNIACFFSSLLKYLFPK